MQELAYTHEVGCMQHVERLGNSHGSAKLNCDRQGSARDRTVTERDTTTRCHSSRESKGSLHVDKIDGRVNPSQL